MRRGIRHLRPAVRSMAVPTLHRTAWLASFIVVALGAYVVTPLAHAAPTPSAAKRGVPFNGTAAVGALFTRPGGKLGAHFCTASVVSSPAGNLLITAAHCLQGKSLSPAGSIVFAPGYHNGRFPHGLWVVTASYVDSAWATDQDPDDDVAFLIAGRPGTHIQRSTGAETLRIDRPPQWVQVISVRSPSASVPWRPSSGSTSMTSKRSRPKPRASECARRVTTMAADRSFCPAKNPRSSAPWRLPRRGAPNGR